MKNQGNLLKDIKFLLIAIVFSGFAAGLFFWFLIAPDIGQEKVKDTFDLVGKASKIIGINITTISPIKPSIITDNPPQQLCSDVDNDGYPSPAGCAIELDCDDTNPNTHPFAPEICDEIDNDCDSEIDEIQACSCIDVGVDGQKNILLDGEKFFPIGFWSIYGGTDSFPANLQYENHFNQVIDAVPTLYQFIDNETTNGQVKMISQSAITVEEDSLGNESLQLGTLQDYVETKNVFGWEVEHEPNIYAYQQNGQWHYTSLKGDVKAFSELIREHDPCNRLIVMAPGISAVGTNYIPYHSQFVDVLVAQAAFRAPELDIKEAGPPVAGVVQESGKPVLLVIRVEGYQPNRIRLFQREPTLDEIRAQAYIALINGAKGVLFWPFAKGNYGWMPTELFDSEYDIEDSPQHLQNIQNISRDILENKNIFFSQFAQNIIINSSDQGVICKPWSVTENNSQVIYAVCVNAAEQTSPYFGYAGGSENIQLKAHLVSNTNEIFPAVECTDAVDNDYDELTDYNDPDCQGSWDDHEGNNWPNMDTVLQTNTLYIRELDTGITFNTKTINSIKIEFASVPIGGANFDYAIYSDGDPNFTSGSYPNQDSIFELHRDLAPDTKIMQASTNVTQAGIKTITLPNPVTIKHTRKYFVVIKMNTQGVVAKTRDVRVGAISLPNNADLLNLTEQPPVLRKGKTVTTWLNFVGATQQSVCVKRNINGVWEQTSLGFNLINETFAPYAVHVYKFSSTC